MKRIIAICFTLILVASTTYVLLDTFVLEKRYMTVSSSVSLPTNSVSDSKISLKTYRGYNTTIYAVDVYLGDGQTIQSALADNTYGRNITQTTSSMAKLVGAEVAINGDFYGARNSGYVVRNGELLRAAKTSDNQEDMVIWRDGSMSIVTEGDFTAKELVKKGALQVLSFGPGLVIDGKISVSAGEEVDISMTSNPRTAVGYISDNHYVLVVADGRTKESVGLSLLQLAEFMKNNLDVTQAYNLDGGGSSSMYFNGKIVNRPTTYGSDVSERKVSDILYVK